VIEYSIFLRYGGRDRNELWHKGSVGGEDGHAKIRRRVLDDARMWNTRIAQRNMTCATEIRDVQ